MFRRFPARLGVGLFVGLILVAGCSSYPRSSEIELSYLSGEPEQRGFQHEKYREALLRNGKGPGYVLFITPETPAYIAVNFWEDGTRLGWSPEKTKKEIAKRKKAFGGGACFVIESQADNQQASDLSQFGFRFIRNDGKEFDLEVRSNDEITYHPPSEISGGDYFHAATGCIANVPFDNQSFGLRIIPRFKPGLTSHTVHWLVTKKAK